jgi:hypothetical protein
MCAQLEAMLPHRSCGLQACRMIMHVHMPSCVMQADLAWAGASQDAACHLAGNGFS